MESGYVHVENPAKDRSVRSSPNRTESQQPADPRLVLCELRLKLPQ